ncbi:MAG: pantoate--beta-alanine ligase [Rhodothermaceae bacterium]|nr:pantoate--beta-alanine ligase [Rhodothermaceae bacterium]
MELLHTVEGMQAHADAARAASQRLALVPTMGALHEGHLALVEAARQRADHVTVSIFVNPTQFAPGEDYAQYPRTLDSDLAALESAGGVDAVFAPTPEAMYPFGLPPFTTVHVRDLNRYLCGAFREGHFEGVTTVVTKLFLACRPHVAIFGEKDAQQLAILRRMTAELGFGIEVIGHPIVREADGLALSSRNRYLSAEERQQAVVVSKALAEVHEAVAGGERDPRALVDAMRHTVATAPLAELQYAEVVDTELLQPVETLTSGRYLAALAVFFGATRLIDNTTLDLEGSDY